MKILHIINNTHNGDTTVYSDYGAYIGGFIGYSYTTNKAKAQIFSYSNNGNVLMIDNYGSSQGVLRYIEGFPGSVVSLGAVSFSNNKKLAISLIPASQESNILVG